MALSASFLCSSSSSSVCLSQQLQRPPAGLCVWKERGRGHDDGGSHSLSLMSVVECSSRPQKKCTAHHNKTRPKKHNPYEKNRKPAFYPRLPKPPPVCVPGWDPLPDDQPLPTYKQFNCVITRVSSQ